MVELRLATPPVVAVLASSGACDRVAAPEGATAMRIAPREVLVVGAADLEAVRRDVDEPGAIVEDVSDAWAGFDLKGDDIRAVFARLSELVLPHTGWMQGEVAGAGAKAIVESGRLTILVPAMLGAHVEERIRADAAELLAP